MIQAIKAATLFDAFEALAKEIAKNEAKGEENIVFCEDRLTLLAERAALSSSGGSFLSEVTTFARYLQTDDAVLSKEGSVMKLNELLQKHREDGCFSGNGARAVYETIAQLSASRVDEGALLRAAENTDGVLCRKLSELARLIEEYNAFLREKGLIDENGYLALLPDRIAEGGVENTNVFFFAFPSFTRQALAGVEAAFRNAKSVTGIFLGGAESVYTRHAYDAFVRAAAESGFPCLESTQKSAIHREGRLLLEGLFSPVTHSPERTERIFTFEESDETEELERIASLIKMHISEGVRYREIAVLVPGADYFLTAEKVFSSYKIPFYLERKRPLSEHPFARYALSILEGTASGFLPADADAIASSVCFGDADAYRNYLLRYGAFRGAVRHKLKKQEEIAEFDRESLIPFAEKMRALTELFPRKGTGKTYVDCVRKLFTDTDWESVLHRLKEDAGETGEGFSAAEEKFLSLEQDADDAFQKTLTEITRVAGEREFRVKEFASLFKSGLDACETLMIPPCLDAVFIGDATESRLSQTEILFAAGLTENLPVVTQDTAVIQDNELKRLGEIKVEIQPAIHEVNLRLRENFVLNLVSFSKRLYLSRPIKLKGEETQRSEVLDFVLQRFVPAQIPPAFPYDCSEEAPAMLKMIRERELFLNANYAEGEAGTCRYNAVRRALEEEGAAVISYERQTASPLAATLWQKRETVSPTLLESYFECPFKGFMTEALGLKEKQESATTESDAGIFVHTVLERTAKFFNEIAGEKTLEKKVKEVAQELFEDARFRLLADTAEGRYARERLLDDCIAVTREAWRQLIQSDFYVKETEETLSLSALGVSGKADRIDETDDFVRVIDYKTGYFDDSPIAYYTGRRLQLELYLLASSKEKAPAGAFYFPASNAFQKDGGEGRFRMRGFYNAEDDVVYALDASMPDEEKSKLFDDSRVKTTDGMIIKEGARGMSEKDFSDFLDYAYLVSEKAEGEMREGNFAPSPYGDACERCKMKSLCAFTGEAREEPDCNCAEISAIVRGNRRS